MRRLLFGLLLASIAATAGCPEEVEVVPPPPGGAGGGGIATGKGRVSGKLAVFQSAQSARVQPTLKSVLDSRMSRRLPSLERQLIGARGHLEVPRTKQWLPGEIIVRFHERLTASAALKALMLEGHSLEHRGFASDHLHLIRVRDGEGRLLDSGRTLELAARWRQRPEVRFTEVNARAWPFAVPNDKLYAYQWHYPAMNLPAAWDVTTGSGSVVVAVVDTGIVPHPELSPRVLPGFDMIGDPAIAGDGNGRDTDPTDMGRDLPNGESSWHGTHVAGTIGAVTNNGDLVSGVDWNAKLLPVRVLGRGGGTTFDIAAGMAWATGQNVPGVPQNPNPARVVNLSLGGGDSDPSPTYQDVIDPAVGGGAIFVIAAGNSNENASRTTPCNQNNVICVGSTRFSGARASYSNFGPPLDVMAPGGEVSEDLNGDTYPDGVLSTFRDGNNQPFVEFQQGTSMASPHVAGLVALMKAARPALTHAEAENILKATAGASSRCNEGCGAGLVNAHAAVLQAKGQAPSGPAKLSVTTTDLFLSTANPQATIGISNVGGQMLNVTAAAQGPVSFPGGASVAVNPGQTVGLQVAANLAGLPDGTHGATVQLGSNGGSATVNVRIRKGAAGDGKEAVLAIVYQDAAGEWQLAGGGRVPPMNGYTYFFDVDPGTYYVVAAIDEDNDGEFFEDGERVGFYPTMDAPEEITVQTGLEVANVDFALVPLKAVSGTPGNTVGVPCQTNGECSTDGVCVTSWPGGYCTKDCSVSACPVGSKCYLVTQTDKACLSSCTQIGANPSDCRTGYVCYPDGTGIGFCLPACSSDADCGSGYVCVNGYCQ